MSDMDIRLYDLEDGELEEILDWLEKQGYFTYVIGDPNR